MKNIDDFKLPHTGKEYTDLIRRDLANPRSALNKYIHLDLIDKLPAPPKNSSSIVLDELKFMQDSMRNAEKSQLNVARNAHDLDDFYDGYADFVNALTGENYTNDAIRDITARTDGLINWVKYQYLRPRPYQLAKKIGVDLDSIVDKRYTTGSYPSGHACEAYVLGYTFSVIHPKFSKKIYEYASDIAHSRIVAGVHFPTDIVGGKLLAEQIINHNLHSADHSVDWRQ